MFAGLTNGGHYSSALDRIARRGNLSKIRRDHALCCYVEEKLQLGWSPEQISLRLSHEYRQDKTMRISYEAIYQEIYRRVHRGGHGMVKQGEKDLRSCLARGHKRRQKKGSRKTQRAERERALPSIEDRPAMVTKRSRVGDWEDDTMVSRACRERIKSVNERKSGIVFFGKTKDGTAEGCDAVLLKRLSVLPQGVRHTLTRDRGSENLAWEQTGRALGMEIYFAHAYSSYERGSNENLNGLFRRYFPKKTNWASVSDEEIARVEQLINTRPRKRLGGLTPVEVFYRETGVALFP